MISIPRTTVDFFFTDICISVALEKGNGVGERQIASGGLPAPAEQVAGVGFGIGDAAPALEDLLTALVVAGLDLARVANPSALGIVARCAAYERRWIG